jgi:hypothetical protein
LTVNTVEFETLLDERVPSELQTICSQGERLRRWAGDQFEHCRVRTWAEAVGADDETVCARVAAASALESQRQRNLPLPNWRAFTWSELLAWSAAESDASALEAARTSSIASMHGWYVFSNPDGFLGSTRGAAGHLR